MTIDQSDRSACMVSRLKELITPILERIGYDLLSICTDPDYFSLKVSPVRNRVVSGVEPLVGSALDLLGIQLTSMTDFQRTSSYFIGLHPGPVSAGFFTVEVDHLTTSPGIIYLEAYCYNDFDELIGKGGTLILPT